VFFRLTSKKIVVVVDLILGATTLLTNRGIYDQQCHWL
jgi:hypothetical protein